MYLEYNCNTSRLVKRAHNGIIPRRHSLKGQRGSVLVYVTLMLATIFSFAALAIDVGYLFVVRSELQNAADAVALTIAGRLYPLNGSQPNWTAAKTYENAAITLNKAASAQLTDGQVDYGYWNITGSPSPSWRSLPHTPVANDFPAVKVTISKTSAHNGGGVNTVFARVLGINSLDASATAVAVVASPGYIMAGAELPNHKKQDIFPVVITKCMYNNYWNSRTNQPTTNPPTTFTVGSSYHYSGCEGGQWTSLNLDTNNVPDIRKLIDYASGAQTNPSPAKFSIGDNIWIQPGTKTTLYSPVDGCSARGDKTCEYVVVPVVCFNAPACDTLPEKKGPAPIVGFACLHILQADGGNQKDITVQMAAMGSRPECKVSGGGLSLAAAPAPAYGINMPPKLANYSGNTY